MKELFFSFAIAILINYLLAKPIDFLTRYIKIRFISVLIVFLGFLSVISLLIAYFIPASLEQLFALKKALPSIVTNLFMLLINLQTFLSKYQIELPLASLDTQVIIKQILSVVPKINYQSIGSIAFTLLAGSVGAVSYTILTIILSFYLLVDGKRAWEMFLIPFSKRMQLHLKGIKEKADLCLYSFLIGQIEIASLTSLVMLITYLVLGVPFALLFALLQLLEIVPVIGTWVAIVISIVVIIFTSGFYKGLIAFAIYFAYAQLVRDSFVAPKILGESLGYHPLAIIITLVVGAQLAGIPGVILALPVLAIIISVIDYNIELRKLKVRH